MSQTGSTPETPPLCFHQTHGSDIQLSNSRTTARRSSTTHTGLVFSSIPLEPLQKFSLKLSEICDNVRDIISIGFTPQDPIHGHVPPHSIKIYTRLRLHYIKDKTLYFYATASGRIHFGIDAEEKGTCDGKIRTEGPFWAFVQLHHTSTTIELVNSQPPDWSNLNLVPMMLHKTRGRNVMLVKNKAEKYDKRLNVSYAFTSRPLHVSEHVVVKILDIDNRSSGGLMFGLTTCNPTCLPKKDLPDDIESFSTRPEYWVKIGDPSWKFKPYDRISFNVTNEGVVKVWRNHSTLLKVVPVGGVSEMWAFFDISAVDGVEVTSCLLPGLERSAASQVRQTLILAEDEVGESSDDVSECVVCCDRRTEAALYPCGHMCMCYECAREQWRGVGHGKCPICRVMIRDVLKIYKT